MLSAEFLLDTEFLWGEVLAHHTTFRIGGPVACLARPRSEGALLALLARARKEQIRHVVLGGGSNVLAPDDSWEALVIQLTHCCSKLERSGSSGGGFEEVRIGAGVSTAELLRFCVRNGLEGVGFLTGIPGTIGGALVMNAGTRSGCMADSLVWIEVIDHEGRRRRIERAELQPVYRSMGLSPDWIVLSGCFRLKPVPKGKLKAELRELMQQRKQAQPLGWPSAGCVFKNPPAHSAGALIDQTGMKGYRVGGAQVSEKHANWILNRGGARAGDVLELMERIEARVFERFGVRLERELKVFE